MSPNRNKTGHESGIFEQIALVFSLPTFIYQINSKKDRCEVY